MYTINLNLSITRKPEEPKPLILVEGLPAMTADEFLYFLQSACAEPKNPRAWILPEDKHAKSEPLNVPSLSIATRPNREISAVDTKENPMPKEKKTYEERIRAQIARLRRKNPNASTEELRAAAEVMEQKIAEALSSLDFSTMFSEEV